MGAKQSYHINRRLGRALRVINSIHMDILIEKKDDNSKQVAAVRFMEGNE